MSNSQYNAELRDWQKIIPSTKPGQGRIEPPGGFTNPVWQTRKHQPSQFELDFMSALETVFMAGAVELPDVVTGLNNLEFFDRSGRAWTEQSFQQELSILGQ